MLNNEQSETLFCFGDRKMHVNDFLKLNEHGLKLSKSAYYSRIRENKIRHQSKTIVKVLNLTRDQMNDIFEELVS